MFERKILFTFHYFIADAEIIKQPEQEEKIDDDDMEKSEEPTLRSGDASKLGRLVDYTNWGKAFRF